MTLADVKQVRIACTGARTLPLELIHGDCVAEMAKLDADSVDAIVCDPPYGLEFMGKEWDKLDAGLPQEAVWKGRRGQGGGRVSDDDTRPASRHHIALGGNRRHFKRCTKCGKRAFSGSPCECDAPEWIYETPAGPPSGMVRMQRWHQRWAEAALRVLKPGGHLLAFGGTRTSHRLTCAVEDAGFEIRDSLIWLYGTGFPKSHNVGKQDGCEDWQGWGTALKPGHEPVVVARKPCSERTVAANVQRHGTGAINVDGCRVGTTKRIPGSESSTGPTGFAGEWGPPPEGRSGQNPDIGRWPANVVLSHTPWCNGVCAPCCPVPLLDAQSGVSTSTGGRCGSVGMHGFRGQSKPTWSGQPGLGDTGGASRFFYCAKASRSERNAGLAGMPEQEWIKGAAVPMRDDRPNRPNANPHPTVKPVALMRWLVRLVTPAGGTVLDPFMGSGTTGIACVAEGFDFIGIEQDAEYLEIARRRIKHEEAKMPLFSQEGS